MINKVTEGMSGKTAAEILYQNDLAVLGAVSSGFKSTIKPTDPAPTVDGMYKPVVPQVAGYSNAGGLVFNNAEGGVDYGYDVQFYKKGATWEKVRNLLPKADNKINAWVPTKSYTAGQQVTDAGFWFEAVVNTSEGQRPGVVPDTVWKKVTRTVSTYDQADTAPINSAALRGFLDADNVNTFLGGRTSSGSDPIKPYILVSNAPPSGYATGVLNKNNTIDVGNAAGTALNVPIPASGARKVEWSGRRRVLESPSGLTCALLYTDNAGAHHVLIDFLTQTPQYGTTSVEKIIVEIPLDAVSISASSLAGAGVGNAYVKVIEGFAKTPYNKALDDYIARQADTLLDPNSDSFSKFINPLSPDFLGGDLVIDPAQKTALATPKILIASYGQLTNQRNLLKSNTLNNAGGGGIVNIDVRTIYPSKVRWKGRQTTETVSGLYSPLIAVGFDGSLTILLEYIQGPQKTVQEVVEVVIPPYTAYISTATLPSPVGGFSLEIIETYKHTGSASKEYWRRFINEQSPSIIDASATALYLSKPQLLRLDFTGELPTDASDARTPSRLTMRVSESNQVIFQCNTELAIQGRSSATHPKKGFSLDMFTPDWEDDLEVKWGDWYLNSGFHLKAFWGDELLTRDVSASRVWGQIMNHRPFPQSWGAQFTVPTASQSSKYLYQAEAKFYTDGIPADVYLNGRWLGLYIWRMKKARDNYRTVKADPKNIHLESFDGGTYLNVWNPNQWELRTPDLSGYVPGQAVPSQYVNDAMLRFTSWVEGCRLGNINFNATYAEYINLDNWIDYLIFSEMFYGIDGLINNYQLISWDGLIFYIFPYDLDYILGYRTGVAPNINYTGRVISVFRNDVLNLVNANAMPQIKERYAELRRARIVDTTNMYNTFKEIPAIFGEKRLKANFDTWGSYQFQNFGHKSSLQWLMQSYMNRLAYLDGVFTFVG